MLCTVSDSEHEVFVPMSDYYSETNEWSKAGAKLWARLWSATTFRQFHRKFHFAWKQNLKVLVAARNLQINKTFLTLELSQYSKRNSTFSSRAWESVPASSNCSLQPTRKHPHCHPVFVHASLTSPSCAGALPQELGIWFCSQNLLLFFWNSLWE